MTVLKGDRIRKLRRELGMSQEELAGKIGVSKLAVLSYENEKRNPEMKTVPELARALACTTDYLFGLSDNRIDEMAIEENENWGSVKYALKRCGEEHRRIIAIPTSEFLESTAQIVLEPNGDKLRQLAVEILSQISLCYEYVSEMNNLEETAERADKATIMRIFDEVHSKAMSNLIEIGKICRGVMDSPKTQDFIKTLIGVLDDGRRLKLPSKKTLDSIWLQIRDADKQEVTSNADTQEHPHR